MSETVDFTTRELDALGIKYAIEERGKHVAVCWKHNGEERQVFCSRSPSDHRAPQKARTFVRRMLRQDGYDLDHPAHHKPRLSTLAKILAAPSVPADPLVMRVDRLENEFKIALDLFMSVASAFEGALDSIRDVSDEANVQVRVDVSQPKLGALLTLLYKSGFTQDDIDVVSIEQAAPVEKPVAVETPPPVMEKKPAPPLPEKKHAPPPEEKIPRQFMPSNNKGKKQFHRKMRYNMPIILAAIRALGICTQQDVRNKLGATIEDANRITQHFTRLAKDGEIIKINGRWQPAY